jgi:hypothetical protein
VGGGEGEGGVKERKDTQHTKEKGWEKRWMRRDDGGVRRGEG